MTKLTRLTRASSVFQVTKPMRFENFTTGKNASSPRQRFINPFLPVSRLISDGKDEVDARETTKEYISMMRDVYVFERQTEEFEVGIIFLTVSQTVNTVVRRSS